MLRAEKNSQSRGNKAIVMYTAILMALFTLVLAACGSNVGGQGQATTPTSNPIFSSTEMRYSAYATLSNRFRRSKYGKAN